MTTAQPCDENLVRLRTRTYPHPYPSGWYAVARSSELKRGAVAGHTIAGNRIALFRTDDERAEPIALDAYCPHLGADLSGGRVEGDGLRCPFHAWRFDTKGAVTNIPYSDVPLKRSLRTGCWRVRETFGLVFVWFGADEASREPFYELPTLDDIDAGGMRLCGDRDGGEVAMHISEILENAADTQHFQFVHREMMVPFTQRTIPGLHLDFEAEFAFDRVHRHVAHLRVDSTVHLVSRRLGFTQGKAHVRFVGPGALLIFELSLPKLGRVVLLHTHTPVEPLLQQVRYRWYADRALPRPLVAWLAGAWISQVRSDYAIWANKIYAKRPMLVPEDGPMLEMRRWYKQFYPRDAREVRDAPAPRTQARDA
jgi:cholesterol 7-dehydrogenase